MFYPKLGPYEWITYRELYDKIINFGYGLAHIGMKPKDCLAMFDETKLEWTVAARACSTQNLIVFTVYANLGEDALKYALNQGNIKYILTNGGLLKTLSTIKPEIPSLEKVIYTGTAKEEDLKKLTNVGITYYSFDEIEKLGKENPKVVVRPLPDDINCIMYTSGSTGNPKGVVITHKNIAAAVAGMVPIINFRSDDVFLHFLPMAHIFAYVVEAVLLFKGSSLGYGNHRTIVSSGVRECKGDLEELRPTLFVGVPALYERIMHGITNIISKSGSIKQFLFKTAFQTKLNVLKQGDSSSIMDKVAAKIWDKIVFKKIKNVVGGRMRIMVSGSAPLNPKVHDFMRVCFDVPLIQGYGLTETSSSGIAQTMQDNSSGTIGCPFPSIEVKLVDVPDFNYSVKDKPYPRGEIWLRGAPITQGYFKNDKLTKEVFQDGWFATGDIGCRFPDGRFAIIDRKKNLIKPPHGEYIALEKLESVYRNCPYVMYICVYVDSTHSECVALVHPNRVKLIEWAKSTNHPKADNFDALCEDPNVANFILKELKTTGLSQNLKSIEMVRKVKLFQEEWTPQNNMLTAAMKLNRNVVIENSREYIKQMYKELGHDE